MTGTPSSAVLLATSLAAVQPTFSGFFLKPAQNPRTVPLARLARRSGSQAFQIRTTLSGKVLTSFTTSLYALTIGWNDPSLIIFCVALRRRFKASVSGISSVRVMFLTALLALLAASLRIFRPATVAP